MTNLPKGFPFSKATFPYVRKAESIVKAMAHYRRIAILELLSKKPGQSVSGIADTLGMDMQNASQHLQKMTASGLIYKNEDGNFVHLYLTPLGEFARAFSDNLIRNIRDGKV